MYIIRSIWFDPGCREWKKGSGRKMGLNIVDVGMVSGGCRVILEEHAIAGGGSGGGVEEGSLAVVEYWLLIRTQNVT